MNILVKFWWEWHHSFVLSRLHEMVTFGLTPHFITLLYSISLIDVFFFLLDLLGNIWYKSKAQNHLLIISQLKITQNATTFWTFLLEYYWLLHYYSIFRRGIAWKKLCKVKQPNIDLQIVTKNYFSYMRPTNL